MTHGIPSDFEKKEIIKEKPTQEPGKTWKGKLISLVDTAQTTVSGIKQVKKALERTVNNLPSVYTAGSTFLSGVGETTGGVYNMLFGGEITSGAYYTAKGGISIGASLLEFKRIWFPNDNNEVKDLLQGTKIHATQIMDIVKQNEESIEGLKQGIEHIDDETKKIEGLLEQIRSKSDALSEKTMQKRNELEKHYVSILNDYQSLKTYFSESISELNTLQKSLEKISVLVDSTFKTFENKKIDDKERLKALSEVCEKMNELTGSLSSEHLKILENTQGMAEFLIGMQGRWLETVKMDREFSSLIAIELSGIKEMAQGEQVKTLKSEIKQCKEELNLMEKRNKIEQKLVARVLKLVGQTQTRVDNSSTILSSLATGIMGLAMASLFPTYIAVGGVVATTVVVEKVSSKVKVSSGQLGKPVVLDKKYGISYAFDSKPTGWFAYAKGEGSSSVGEMKIKFKKYTFECPFSFAVSDKNPIFAEDRNMLLTSLRSAIQKGDITFEDASGILKAIAENYVDRGKSYDKGLLIQRDELNLYESMLELASLETELKEKKL